MAFHLININNIFNNNKFSLVSVASNSLYKNVKINNIKNVTRRNLNTFSLLSKSNTIYQKKSKSFFSISPIYKDFNSNGPKVKPLEKTNHSFLELVQINNNFNPNIHKVVPFYFDTVILGVMPEKAFTQLKKYNNTFDETSKPFSITSHKVSFSEQVDTFEKRCKVMNDLLTHWRDNETFSCLKGWRNELYPIFDGNHEIAFNIERSGIALFGFRAYGCHINGYVEDPDTHKLKMWIAQRSFNKQTFPGKLDNIVAGGVSFPYNPTETAIKECLEEASMPPEISKQVVPCGAITYISVEKRGISSDSQYVFDLKLPTSYKPKPNDNEVEGFYLMEFDEIIERLKKNEFKINSGIVIIDFMIRHGILTHSMEENYLEILSNIHRPIPFPGPNFIKMKNKK